jgi:hypothetical protein
VLRSPFIALAVILSGVAGLGCATQDRAARSAEQAAADDSDDAAACQKKGGPDTPAYETCRKELAEAKARAGAMQEQRRRDFDRTLGAGTEGQNGY